MSMKPQDEPIPLPPGVWEALAKEILTDGKDGRTPPHFSPMVPMTAARSEHQSVAVVQRDLPHFLRDDDSHSQGDQAGERSGFGPVAVALCLIGATAAGLGGYLVSSSLSQGNSAFAWVEQIARRFTSGQDSRSQDSRTPTEQRAPSRVESAFAETSRQEVAREGATLPQKVTVTGTLLSPVASSEANAAPTTASTPKAPVGDTKPDAAASQREVATIDPGKANAAAERTTAPAPVAPVAAPAPARSAEPVLRGPTAESTRLVQRARKMIEDTGDIAGARLLLSRAVEIGDAQAAFLLGETYDTRALAGWGVVGLRGDPVVARRFYEQALAGGVADARSRIVALGN